MIHRYKPPSDSEDKAKQARRIYWCTYAGAGLLFMAGVSAVLDVDWFVLLIPVWAFSDAVATWVLRSSSTSQQSCKGGIIERDARAALTPYLSEAPAFEVKSGLSLSTLGSSTLVSREGIEVKSVSGRRRVLWRDVQSCAFVVLRNVRGSYSFATIVLRGNEGKTLLHLSPSEEQVDQLLPAIRFYLRGPNPEENPQPGDTL